MLTMLLIALSLGPADRSDDRVTEAIPGERELFAKEDWYRSQPGREQDFDGMLELVRRDKDVAGFGRFNPYRLIREGKGTPPILEVYVGGKDELLAPYAGKRVRLTGKRVDMEVEGSNHREIWPARVKLLATAKEGPEKVEQGKPDDKTARELKIIATAFWPHGVADPDRPREGKQLVVLGPAELSNMQPWNRLDAPDIVVQKMATAEIAKLLKVPAIDWKKEMLVIVTAGVKPTGGWKVEIGPLMVEEGKLTIHYSVTPPRGGIATQALTHPGVVALVERFEGPTRFVMSGGRKVLPGQD